jgi:GNAT superfamily N-acetyltransferase
MKIYDCQYTHSDTEYEELWRLLVDSYALTGQPHNWFFGRLENWRYAKHDKPPTFFMDCVHLWRNADAELIGYYISESGDNCIHLQVHPDYGFVEADMLSWVECNWTKDRGSIETYAYHNDDKRQKLLTQLGYEDMGHSGNTWQYDLSKPYPALDLPPGFQVQTLADNHNYDSHIAVQQKTFNNNTYLDQAWFGGKSSAPSYSFEWDFAVVSPEGEHVAFCLAWLNPQTRMAEIDPVGTHPDYRRQGFAKAVISECFRRLQTNGIRYAYIGSAPEPNISNYLYQSLQPVEKYREHRWVKKLD